MTPERDSLTNASKSISDDVNLLMAKHASISRRAPGRRQYLALFSVLSQGVAGYQGWEQQILLTAEHQVPGLFRGAITWKELPGLLGAVYYWKDSQYP